MMIKTVVGDLLDATEDIIVQQVNCRSVMGSGVAKAIYTRWPEVKTEYHKFCRRSTSPYDLLGKVQLIDVEPGKAVANVFGQLNYGRTAGKVYTDYVALTKAFDQLRTAFHDKSLAFPYNLKYVQDDIGKKKISSIKYSDVKAYYNRLIREQGFKPNSMEIIHTIIHPVFTMAVRDGYIRINPATGAMAEIKKSHNWEKPKRHALTIAEQTAFIDYMRNHKVYNHWLPLFTVLLGTGCRIGEAIGLRWEDCDFDEGIISINHNMVYRKYEADEKARFHIVTPKTSAGVRIVPMLSEVKAALQAEWETQKIVGFNESVVDGYTGFIFQNRYGDPLSPHSVNRAIDRICAAYIEDETVLADQEGRDPVLIRHFSAHNLRHTFCTRFCENERNIKVIQEIMGHADIETTMNIYAEATKEKKKESFSNLEGKIKIS